MTHNPEIKKCPTCGSVVGRMFTAAAMGTKVAEIDRLREIIRKACLRLREKRVLRDGAPILRIATLTILKPGLRPFLSAQETTRCLKCNGCGKIANTPDGEPWTAWLAIPLESSGGVLAGCVKPISCPECSGTGKVAPTEGKGG